jgi:S-adenosylmethionine:tRNA ribosyltransferase-isomerase
MIPMVDIEAYSYNLPGERIARYPLPQRDGSRLLVYNRGRISHLPFHQLPTLLHPDLMMVFNDTRVVQARLGFEKHTGSRIEIFCLEPYEPSDYNLAFQMQGSCVWKCLVGNAKKWKDGPLVKELGSGQGLIKASMEGRDKDAFLVRFTWQPGERNFGHILDTEGKTPIPPYLERPAVDSDKETYQTVYARVDGSVAAPTAGLHFTGAVLKKISDLGIPRINFTLHVGAGTFQPVSPGGLEKHPMHAERFHATVTSIENLLIHRGRTLAVGTTTTRILESLYWLGCKIHSSQSFAMDDQVNRQVLFLDQWEAYKLPPLPRKESLSCLLDFIRDSGLDHIEAVTRLMILPGYSFQMTDCMITNFHLPRSTLLLLVGAFIGEDWEKVYQYALENDFRFLSYGDSSILIP